MIETPGFTFNIRAVRLAEPDDAEIQRRWERLRRLSLEYAPRRRSRWPWLVVLAFLVGFAAGAGTHLL